MKNTYFLLLLICLACQADKTQNSSASANQKEFKEFITHLESEFIYHEDKKEIIECIKQEYHQYVDTISRAYYKVLFYENLLNELYDSHINLNTNTDKSYRLSSPIYVGLQNNRFFIKNVFSTRLDYTFSKNIINAEIISFNGLDFHQAIDAFPTKCHDKNKPEIKEWLANKIFAGKRNESRIINLKLSNGEHIDLDIDSIKLKENVPILAASIVDNIGIISINDALGNSDLVAAFDSALNSLMNTKALILDLRNTSSGGNTSVAEPIMARFIAKKEGYQICENKKEKYMRYVMPKGGTYSQPLYVLVGRWTGSMGEGMVIGFDGMKRATIVGTEMSRLAGGMKTVKFLNSDFGFRVSFEKMYHLDGTLRETFIPEEYINQATVSEDEFLEHALKLIESR